MFLYVVFILQSTIEFATIDMLRHFFLSKCKNRLAVYIIHLNLICLIFVLFVLFVVFFFSFEDSNITKVHIRPGSR